MQPTHDTQAALAPLYVETRTMVPAGDSYLPSMFLGGRKVSVNPPQWPAKGWGGYLVAVIDRQQFDADGVRLCRAYNVETGDASGYTKVFTTMLDDLRSGDFINTRYVLVLATCGILNAFPPPPEFLGLLWDAGAGPKLKHWLDSARCIGTACISADVNYIFAGVMKSHHPYNPPGGHETLGLYPFPSTGRVPHTDVLDAHTRIQDAGDPSVLVPAESQAGA